MDVYEVQATLNKIKHKNEKLTQEKTGWMIAAIILGILFLITLGIVFAR